MKTLMNMMIALLLLTANATIAQAINYPTYNNSTQAVYVTPSSLTPGYKAGDEVFQTSNLTPMVDEDGYAVEPYSESAASGPRRAGDTRPGGSDQGGTGGHSGDNMIPIGSILVLMLFALMHVAYIAYSTSARKQK